MTRIFFLFFFWYYFFGEPAPEYGFNVKKEGKEPITRLQIFSERCSGSNYICELIKRNLPIGINDNSTGPYGHKHFPPWFQLPMRAFHGPRHHYSFQGCDDTLFVIIFRNPYDWLRSFNLEPHYGAKHLHGLPMSRFIRTPWRLNEDDPEIIERVQSNPYLDYDPLTKMPFENVMKLRTAKIQTMLLVKDRVKNFYCINYEVARDHPEEVIDEIARIYGLQRKHPHEQIDMYKGWSIDVPYTPKKYCPITTKDLIYINQQLDENLEHSINYALIDTLNE